MQYDGATCCSLSCRRVEAQRRKDRTEALLYFSVEVYRDDDFQQHNGPDLISDNPPTTTFRVLKTDSLEVFKMDLAEALVRALARSGVCEGSRCVCGCGHLKPAYVRTYVSLRWSAGLQWEQRNGGSTMSPVVWPCRVILSCPLCRVTLSNTLGSGPLRGEATAPFDQDPWMKWMTHRER